MLKTIREVLSHNLETLRGDRTQAEMAELAGIPFRTYQGAEYGAMPKPETLAAIAKALGVPESKLFEVPRKATPAEEQEVLDRAIEGLKFIALLTPAQRRIFDILPSVDDEQAARLLKLVETRQAVLGPKKRD